MRSSLWLRRLFATTSGRPPLRRTVRPAEAGSDTHIYVLMVAAAGSLPVLLSLMKGCEKRLMWVNAPAEVEAVEGGGAQDDHQHVTYVYEVDGKRRRHTQRQYAPIDGPWQPYKPGDRVYVKVHPRNDMLSILDPPVFQRLWRDLNSPYVGQRAD